jgi:hypothetical protein
MSISNDNDDTSNAPPLVRVEVSARKIEQLRACRREMLAGYPYLGSLASSDMIPFHAVRTDQFRWVGTDGVGIYFNDTPDGFFSEPGHVPMPEVPANVAAATGIKSGAIIPPNPHSNRKALTADERTHELAREILRVVREDALWAHTFKMQGWVPVPRGPKAPEGRLPFDAESFQNATDGQINDALKADEVGKAPEGSYFNQNIKWNTEFGEAYAHAYEERQKKQNNPPPSPNNPGPTPGNQGGGDILKPGQGGDPNDPSTDPGDAATQPQSPTQAAQSIAEGRAEREVMHKRAQEMARQMGRGSTAIEQMVSKNREPGVDWRSYVMGFLSRAGGASAWDWQRPARPPLLRDMIGVGDQFFSPSRSGYGVGTIVVWMDTSGSIQADEHRAFLGAVAEMLENLRPKRLVIGFCDDAVQRVDGGGDAPKSDGMDSVDVDESFATYSIPKGMGTSFIPPFEWMREHMAGDELPDAMLYLTDLEGYAPTKAPPFPVLWCNINPRLKRPIRGGAFGEVIYIPVSDLQPEE